MMDDETLQMYVEESKEHLEDIESDLLQMEQDGAAVDEELVNKVFRAAHSIKGGAGFMGLNVIKELAHKIENNLDLVRNKELVPTSEVVNILLGAFDRLRELVDNIADSNDMDVSEHLVALEGLKTASLQEDDKDSAQSWIQIQHSDGRMIFTHTEYDLVSSLKGGKKLYLLEFDLIHDVHRQNFTPMQVIDQVCESGVIIDLLVDFDKVGTLDDEDVANNLPMYVLFASSVEPDLIGQLLNLPEKKITVLAHDSDQLLGKSTLYESGGEHTQQKTTETKSQTFEKKQPKRESKTGTEKKAPTSPSQEQAPDQSGKELAGPDKGAAAKGDKSGGSQLESLRVNVNVLDQLMNQAGELVLARNQLLQAIKTQDQDSLQAAGQRIDLVTSELQNAIMLTRMQAVGTIFNKFPRVVRDLARDLGKSIDLDLQGKDVELDKAIIEGLGDPLTHLVRNSADHGIESPEEREANNKPRTGSIRLQAYHESGQVNILIQDDGKGMDADKIADKAVSKGLIEQDKVNSMSAKEKMNLILLPGLSTTDQISDVSGRGVGMDVVKSNLDKLGGQLEIDSRLGQGTWINIKLPLTLAIIPSLLVSCRKERFAIPQVNVSELIRIAAHEVEDRIDTVGRAEVFILRGEILPLLDLAQVLGLDQIPEPQSQQDRTVGRKTGKEKDVNLVVVQAGSFKYGLMVDRLHDSVEIVVKPLGRHLKTFESYAGATIMGDGHVALILDVAGLARIAELSSMAGAETELLAEDEHPEQRKNMIKQSLFTFYNAPGELCALPLDQVSRVEKIKASDIELVGGKKIVQYRNGALPLYALEEVANVGMLEDAQELIVIVSEIDKHSFGFLAAPPVDTVETDILVDEETLRQTGVKGSTIIRGQTTLLIDLQEVLQAVNPHWFGPKSLPGQHRPRLPSSDASWEPAEDEQSLPMVLLAEDSEFFRDQVKRLLEEHSYRVFGAEDGEAAWKALQEHSDQVGLVLTDLEMPNMDGFELTKHIREDDRFAHLPVIALTSLAGEEEQEKGKRMGIDEYHVKLDKDKLLHSLAQFMPETAGA
ncbi:MAG: chemotaxis protein CheW [Thermodesulfobacteriota bacterium]